MSSSGQYQTAINSTSLYYSSNYGVDWTQSNIIPPSNLISIAMSSSGQYQLIGLTGPNGIYYSKNYGVTWSQSSILAIGSIASVASSSSGQYQIAVIGVGFTGKIWFSINYGVNWTSLIITSKKWQGVAMSSSGQYQTAVSDDEIYYSTNYGLNWSLSNAPSLIWNSVAMSSSGQFQSACHSNGMYYSSNYGVLWNLNNNAATNKNSANSYISMSSSGQFQTNAIGEYNNIYTTSVSTNIGSSLFIQGNETIQGTLTGATGSFTNISASGLIYANGGITGATGSFTYINGGAGSIQKLSVGTLIGAIGSIQNLSVGTITGATGSFTNISASRLIYANGGITGATGSFTNISASGLIYSNGGITGAKGSFTSVTISGNETVKGTITGSTGSFTNISASGLIYANGGITGSTGSFTSVTIGVPTQQVFGDNYSTVIGIPSSGGQGIYSINGRNTGYVSGSNWAYLTIINPLSFPLSGVPTPLYFDTSSNDSSIIYSLLPNAAFTVRYAGLYCIIINYNAYSTLNTTSIKSLKLEARSLSVVIQSYTSTFSTDGTDNISVSNTFMVSLSAGASCNLRQTLNYTTSDPFADNLYTASASIVKLF
jgi:hypothetical protein